MTFLHGKAIEGGRPLTDSEVRDLAREQLQVLRETFSRKPELDKTADVLKLRLAEELRLVQRMIDLVESELGGAQAKQLQASEDAIEDIAEVIEAEDPCDAIQTVDPDLGRRLTRRALSGEAAPCDNRRPSILRKKDQAPGHR